MGLRSHEQLVVCVGVMFLLTVCITAFFFLPSGGADLYFREENTVHVRDAFIREELRRKEQEELRKKAEEAIPIPIPKPEIGAADDAEGRRIFVKQMIKFSWDGYRKYAWGENELRPNSRSGHSSSIFGYGKTGATIIDAIDTLYIVGLKEEYKDAREWISHFDFKEAAKGDLSVFETNIRFTGGLLSAYALTGDKMFLKKAEEVATVLLPAFDTPSGIPYSLIDLQTGRAKTYSWASGKAILSEYGSIQLEFDYLSNLTGNPVFAEKANKIRDVLTSMEKPEGLYPIYISMDNPPRWGQHLFSMGAMADSWYEYLLKQWISTGKTDDRTKREYEEAMFAMEKRMLFKSEPSNLWYFAKMNGNRVEHSFEHLACFCGGMAVLHSMNEPNRTISEHYLTLGKEIGHTCHESYSRSTTGIGPESFQFTSSIEAKTERRQDSYYILRPEVVETWFYLWRATKDEKYRQWAWDHVQNLEKYAKGAAGYSGIRNVYDSAPEQDDVQQSFLFAELFKYLYLIFSDDSVLSLDQWVFNTEAHPFRIRRP
uniref:alpha-1,2-Mannosidase n=1 Tax=Caenorhabditis tropicalis TaxID=1561998 RepID=A0A1I7UZX4_9PELO